jgi:uncharacterized repeat protein (TIGR03803 family)
LGGVSDLGTVFKLDATGAETVLHSFTGGPTDGAQPRAGLIRDRAGNLYGTTMSGNVFDQGTVFKLDATGAETILHSFVDWLDGRSPQAGLIRDAAGNLYGTTTAGGASNLGTVFKLDSTGTETVLYDFKGGADGSNPYAGLLPNAAGAFYGTTCCGSGSDFGTVFKLDTTGTETVLYSFTGSSDGKYPTSGLVRDAVGNLYGTSPTGGNFGLGAVFKLSR